MDPTKPSWASANVLILGYVNGMSALRGCPAQPLTPLRFMFVALVLGTRAVRDAGSVVAAMFLRVRLVILLMLPMASKGPEMPKSLSSRR